jgi:hypothetical protein
MQCHAGGPIGLRLRQRTNTGKQTAITHCCLYPNGNAATEEKFAVGFEFRLRGGIRSRFPRAICEWLSEASTHWSTPGAGPSGASKFSGPLDLQTRRRRGRTPRSGWGLLRRRLFFKFRLGNAQLLSEWRLSSPLIKISLLCCGINGFEWLTSLL